MHKVLVDTDSRDKPAFRSEGDREHTIKLIQMLSLKMDSVARSELFMRCANERGMQGYMELLEEAKKRDLAHVQWLKEQILRSLR